MKAKILKKEIKLLKKHFGNHTKAAIAIGIDLRYYRRIRNKRNCLVGQLMRNRFNQILSECKPKDLIQDDHRAGRDRI